MLAVNTALALISIELSVDMRILCLAFSGPVRSVGLWISLSIEYTSPALGTACWALVANGLVDRKLIANLYQSGILN